MKQILLPWTQVSSRTALLLVGLAPSMAFAQTGEAPPPTDQQAATAGQDVAVTSDDTSGEGITDIVVTAQRRSERLQEVPIAITALQTEQLEAAGIVNTRDLQLVVPSLFFTQAVFSPQPTIRGIGTRGTNPGDEQVVPTYIDGVYQPFVTGAIFDLANIERVEVLKGPQGTLLGRNATGGAINIITAMPSVEPHAKVTVGYGSFDERELAVYVTGGSGIVAASLDTRITKDDGYVRDLTTGGTFGAIYSRLARLKIAVLPTSDTDIILAASVADRDDTTGIASYPYQGNTSVRRTAPGTPIATGNREIRHTAGLDRYFNIRQYAGSLTLKHRFDFAELTSISAYQNNLLRYQLDADITPAPQSVQTVRFPDESFTQEVYLTSSNSGPFAWTLGGFYFHDVAGFKPRRVNALFLESEVTTQAYALYAQGAYKLTDELTVTAGGRYSIDEKSYEAFGLNPSGSVPLTQKTFRSFNPSLTIDYQPNRSLLIYAKYGSAYKSGLFNSASFSAVPVEPEQVESFELGLKSDPLSWLRLNLAAFYTNYDDIQVMTRDPVTTAVLLENAASARIYGVEGDVVVRPIDRLNIRAGISVLHSEYLDYVNASTFEPVAGGGNRAVTINASGNRLNRVPNLTGSVSADYTIPVSFGQIVASANVAYTGDFYWGVDRRLPQDAYAMVNAQIGWKSDDDRYGITLWGRNLTDADPPLTVTSSSLNDSAGYVRPRTFGIRLSARY